MAIFVAFETESSEIDGRIVAGEAFEQHAAEFEREKTACPLVGIEFETVFRNFNDAFITDDAIEFCRRDGRVMVVLEGD